MLKSLDHFEMDEIKVFVDITLSTFNFANVSRGLYGVHWQQTLQMDHVRKHPIHLDQTNAAIFFKISRRMTNANACLFENNCSKVFCTYTEAYFKISFIS